jgi:mannose-1-phosphate guanylyltransferase
MVVAPADHWIGDVPAFRRAVRAAIRAAVTYDTLATIGIRPTHPHPGLGYLCAGVPVKGWHKPRVLRLARFIEKPSRALAQRLMKRPRTYWNSGTFVGTADKFLECITEWLPDHVRRLMPLSAALREERGGRHGPGTASFALRARTAYRTLESVSFDHGVMDHLHGGLVVEGRFPWADLGSLDIWARLRGGTSRTIAVDSERVTVIGQERDLVATIGVRNLLVVQTPSATLICHPDKVQALREVVKRIWADPRLAVYR